MPDTAAGLHAIVHKGRIEMRITLLVVGAVLALLGVIWFLQGVNILPGSFMTGQMKWAVYGAIAFAAGVVTLLFARRLGKT
jgi:uncharacterized integral membrane protein